MFRTTLALVLALAIGATPAFAKKPEKEPRNGHSHRPSVDLDVHVVFAPGQREAARGWIVEKRGRGHCPPGLAKKHNGCLPPGHAKKRYVVGKPLPRGIVLQPLPPGLEVRIGLPPVGFRYGIVDGDIVKLAVGTLLVVDAIDGLVD